MRTTIDIHDDLMKQARVLAAETGRTLTAVVEDALRETLNRRRTAGKSAAFEWPTLHLGPLQPGVDLDNNAALLDLLDQDDDPV